MAMKDIAGRYGQSAKKPQDATQGAAHSLVYHTFFAEYQGGTPEDIVRQMHEESRRGTGLDMSGWWAYQRELWSHKYGIDVPAQDSENAAAGLIDVLLKVGALEQGPRPARGSAPEAKP